MTTRTIGIKEFRQNMSKLVEEGKRKKIRFVVMNHYEPSFEVHPVMDREELEDRLMLEKYGKDIEEALEQVKRGETYTADEVRAMINRKKR